MNKKELQKAVGAEIARIENASRAELLAGWEQVFKRPAPPRLSMEVLKGNLAYQVQAKAFGGLDGNTKRKLRQYYDRFKKEADFKPRTYAPDIRPGTKFVREWKGQVYEVIVSDQGYVFEGRLYKSLSRIAKEITGTSWSGKKFFGVKS